MFGGSINFKRVQEITLSCAFGDFANERGEPFNLTSLKSIVYGDDYNYFYINGFAFGQAKITSSSTDSNDFNTSILINITLKKEEVGHDALNLGGYYSDYADTCAINEAIIDSISESLRISRGENSASMTKEISVKFSDNLLLEGSNSPLVALAQKFVKEIFEYDAANGYATTFPTIGSEPQITDILNKSFKKTNYESLNLISNECSFRQEIKAENVTDNEDGGKRYSHSLTISLTTDETGITTVSEKGKIMGLTQTVSITPIACAFWGYEQEVESSTNLPSGRLQEIYDAYKENCPDDELNSKDGVVLLISKRRTVDEFAGVIDYDFSANDDPNYADSDSGVFYSKEVNFSYADGDFRITENGEIEGLETKIINASKTVLTQRYPKYAQAAAFIAGASTSPYRAANVSYLKSFEQDGRTFCELPTERDEKHSPLQGKIAYSFSYSTEDIYPKDVGDEPFKTISIDYQKTEAFAKKKRFSCNK